MAMASTSSLLTKTNGSPTLFLIVRKVEFAISCCSFQEALLLEVLWREERIVKLNASFVEL